MTGARAAAELNQWGNDMKKIFATAGAVAVLALTATPAQAASQASATARILRPLQLSSDQNLDFGTIVLSGASFSSESVTMNTSGSVTVCGTTAGDLTCSGSPTAARYTVVGANNTTVVVSAPGFNLSGPGGNLPFVPNAPGTVSLGANGNSTGTTFTIGGTLSGLSNSTADGTYTGNFAVTVSYQ